MEASRGAAHLRPGLAADVRGLIGSSRLARRAAAGDERAFATIFERHHQELYRYCLAILRNPTDAEDALQSTMSKALQALPGESREIRLRPWLFRVAHNESIAILRERRPEQTTDDFEPLGGIEPDAAAERSERLRTLVSDLKALPDRQRGALVMRELSGLEYSEIAAALDCGEGAARQTVYEARAALQTREEGRRMECEEARRAISAGDRRRLRGRKLRAHLNGCQGCTDFERAIAARRTDLAALCPPLPLAAAAGIFAGAAGGGAGATGAGLAALGGGAGSVAGGLAGTAALKGASAAAALVLAAGAADATGVIDLPSPFGSGGGDTSGTAAPGSGGGAGATGHSRAVGHFGAGGAAGAAAGEAPGGGSATADEASGGKSGGNPPGHAQAGGKSGDHGKEAAPGQTGTSPGQSGTTPGQSGTAPGQSGSAPGHSDTAAPPGQAGTSPGLSGSTPGQSGTAPGQSSKPVSPPESGSADEASSAPSPPGQDSAPGQSKH